MLAGVFGLGLLAWPFMSFGAIFAFDSPSTFMPLAYYIAFSIWLYPCYWALGLHLGRRSAQRDQPIAIVALKSSVPLLSAMLYIAVPVMGSITWDLLTEEQYNRRFLHAPEVYDLGDDRFAVQNYQGWFTDHQNFNTQNPEPFSAWVVDVSVQTPGGRIELGEANLDRYFFRDTDRQQLKPLEPLQDAAPADAPAYKFKFGDAFLVLVRPDGEYTLILRQE